MDSKELALELLKKGEKRYSVWDVIVSMKGRIFLCLFGVLLVWYQWLSMGFYSDLFFGGIAGLFWEV